MPHFWCPSSEKVLPVEHLHDRQSGIIDSRIKCAIFFLWVWEGCCFSRRSLSLPAQARTGTALANGLPPAMTASPLVRQPSPLVRLNSIHLTPSVLFL